MQVENLVIGGGPGAAVLVGSRKKSLLGETLVVADQLGGLMGKMGAEPLQSHSNELTLPDPNGSDVNCSHFPGLVVSGENYAQYVATYLRDVSPSLMLGRVNNISVMEGGSFRVEIAQRSGDCVYVVARNVFIATGSQHRELSLPDFAGEIVDAMACYDDLRINYTQRYRRKDVIVIGGGNSGMQLAGLLAPHALSVTILSRRYVGLFPVETRDRFALRGKSQVTYEMIEKSRVWGISGNSTSAPYCVRCFVYDSVWCTDNQLAFRYSKPENLNLLGEISMAHRPSHFKVCVETGENFEEKLDARRSVVINATGWAPRYPNGNYTRHISFAADGYIVCDNEGMTDLPGLYIAGSCRGHRAVNDMMAAEQWN